MVYYQVVILSSIYIVYRDGVLTDHGSVVIIDTGEDAFMEPYYNSDGITIYNGNCMDLISDIKADSIMTDPPYGTQKAEWDSVWDPLWMELVSVSAIGLMCGICNLYRCPPVIGQSTLRWVLCAHIINGMTRGGVGFGNWIPCVLYSDGDTSLFKHESDARDFAIGSEPKQDHPSPKPLSVVRWFLSRVPGNVVLDPFMGSGTTLVAARLLGRCAIGVEIEEKYCELAARRLEQATLPLTWT